MRSESTSPHRYLTLEQVSERLATPRETIRYWVHVGKLPAYRPGRQVLIREADLDALVEASSVNALRTAKAKARKAKA